MKIAIVVFKSKTEVFKFIEEMNMNGVPASTIGTPPQARIGCGISVKIQLRHLWLARKIISSGEYRSFYAVYQIIKNGNRTETTKII